MSYTENRWCRSLLLRNTRWVNDEMLGYTSDVKNLSTCATAGVNLEGITKAPQPTLWILGVLLDPKLRWGPHVKRTAERATQQSRALSAITGSTWGATFDKAQLIYNTVVCPVITYGATVWSPLDSLLRPAHRHWIGDALDQQQQRCLWSVTGGFRATSRKQLESEAAVPPLGTPPQTVWQVRLLSEQWCWE